MRFEQRIRKFLFPFFDKRKIHPNRTPFHLTPEERKVVLAKKGKKISPLTEKSVRGRPQTLHSNRTAMRIAISNNQQITLVIVIDHLPIEFLYQTGRKSWFPYSVRFPQRSCRDDTVRRVSR